MSFLPLPIPISPLSCQPGFGQLTLATVKLPSLSHTDTLSLSQPGDFSISMKAPDRIKHFNVKNLPDGRLGIGQRKFDSMDELIQHYRRAPIYTTTNEGKMYLSEGLPRLVGR